jgi:hypothetical protein
VRAAYATILGLPIDDVPRFDPASLADGESQRDRERRWLSSMGLELVEIEGENDDQMAAVLDAMPPVYHLMSGLSPRGLGHRCVGFAGELAFDPHPSRAGLVRVYSVGLLVPLCN